MNKNLKVALATLGCKLNFSETSTISRQFLEHGYDIVKFDEISRRPNNNGRILAWINSMFLNIFSLV